MNKFLIAFSVLLAVCSVCNAYGAKGPVYGSAYGRAPDALGGIVYRVKPRLSVQVVPEQNYGYGAPVISGYGAPALGGYGAPLLSGYGSNIPLSSELLALANAQPRKLDLANQALSLPVPSGYINANPVLGLTKVYAPAAPVVLPAPTILAPGKAYAPAASVY